MSNSDSLLVLYGSQTGNAQSIAEDTFLEASMKGFNPKIQSLNDFYNQGVGSCEEKDLVIIISNTGDGDPPDNAIKFWQWITSCTESSVFDGKRLGNSDYATFNNTGKTLEALLPTLGGKWLTPPTFLDAVDWDESRVENWMKSLWPRLKGDETADESLLNDGISTLALDENGANPSAESISSAPFYSFLTIGKSPRATTSLLEDARLPKLHPIAVSIEELAQAHEAETHCRPKSAVEATHQRPMLGTGLQATMLTAPHALKPIISISFLVEECMWEFEAGDAFGLLCENDPEIVDLLLNLLGIDGNQIIRTLALAPASSDSLLGMINNRPFHIRDLFIKYVDIMHFPKKALLRSLAEYCQDEDDKLQLLFLCSKSGSAEYLALAEGHANIMDFLYSFSSCRPPLECLLSHLPLLYPRYYSICSSPLNKRIEFIYSPMEYQIKDGSKRLGVASRWLNRICLGPKKVSYVEIYPRPSPHFRLPSDTMVPIFMVCSGTGVSPFMGFLRTLRDRGEKRPEVWLFYGFRHREHDFIFKEELHAMEEDGFISRLIITTSREADSGHCKYVQDALRLHSAEIWPLFNEKNGLIYLCGDEMTMIKEVNLTIQEMIVEHGRLKNDEAASLMTKLNQEKRIIRDIWI